MANIELRNLSKRWGTFVGVENFNLTIPDKEFLVLLGPSGCGKTTTMRMIAGLEEVSEGEILINGKVVNRSNETINKDIQTGEIEVVINEFEILGTCKELPMPVFSDQE